MTKQMAPLLHRSSDRVSKFRSVLFTIGTEQDSQEYSEASSNFRVKVSKARINMPLTEEQEKKCQECFEMFDEEDKGHVSVTELKRMMELLGWDPAQKEQDDLIRDGKLKANGKMSKDQFLNLMTIWTASDKAKYKEEDLREAFKLFDKNQSGFIEWDELKYVMQGAGEPLTEEEVTIMMTEADKDEDGKLNYEEFAAMMRGDNDT